MHKLNVVVVDDDIAQRVLFKNRLNKISPPINSLTMSSGSQLLKFFKALPSKQRKEHFIIFLESNMPNRDAWSTLTQLSDLSRSIENLNVIMTGSSVSEEDLELSESYDMVISYLSKPIKQKEIIRSIRTIEPRYA